MILICSLTRAHKAKKEDWLTLCVCVGGGGRERERESPIKASENNKLSDN